MRGVWSGRARILSSLVLLALIISLGAVTNPAQGDLVADSTEAGFTFELWIDTFLNMVSSDGRLEFQLQMDNGTGVPGQDVELIGNESYLVNRTNTEGLVVFPFVEFGLARFNGTPYFNPSETSFNLTGTVDTPTETKSTETKKIDFEGTNSLIKSIEVEDSISENQEFDIIVSIGSGERDLQDVSVGVEIPLETDYAEEKIIQEFLPKGEVKNIYFSTSVDSCGEFLLLVKTEFGETTESVISRFEVDCPKKPVSWASYDAKTDAILVVSDGTHCTESNPCNFSVLHEISEAKEWEGIGKFRNFFTINKQIIIGDGKDETVFTLNNSHVTLNLPILIKSRSRLLSEDSLIQTNVSKDDQLSMNSAIEVESGGTVQLKRVSYKVMIPTEENNFYAERNSRLILERISVQRAEDTVETTLYLPDDFDMEDFNFAKGATYECSAGNECLKEIISEGNEKPKYKAGGFVDG